MQKIFVDDREDPQRIKKLEEHFNVIVGRLDVGDILIPRDNNIKIAIETKTVQDFIQSCNNRRIQKEALQMRNKYDYSYIIIYSDGKLNPKYHKQTVNQKTANLASLEIRYNVPFFWCKNFNEFVSQINSIINAVDKKPEPIEPPLVRLKDSNEKINVLIGIDGVGKQTAKKLLKHFKKPSAVLNATEDELNKVPRLSKKAKKNILRL